MLRDGIRYDFRHLVQSAFLKARMSQRRLKGKNRDHLQSALKQDRRENAIRNNNHLFDELNPPESYICSEGVRIAASVHTAIFNTLLLVSQYIVLYGSVFFLVRGAHD